MVNLKYANEATVVISTMSVPGGHLVLFVLFGRAVVIGCRLPHHMCHSHIERLVGWECDMASQQGWLLHDGIVVATMRMGIPVTKHSLSYRDKQKKNPANKVAKKNPTETSRWQQLTFQRRTKKRGGTSEGESKEGGQGS